MDGGRRPIVAEAGGAGTAGAAGAVSLKQRASSTDGLAWWMTLQLTCTVLWCTIRRNTINLQACLSRIVSKVSSHSLCRFTLWRMCRVVSCAATPPEPSQPQAKPEPPTALQEMAAPGGGGGVPQQHGATGT